MCQVLCQALGPTWHPHWSLPSGLHPGKAGWINSLQPHAQSLLDGLLRGAALCPQFLQARTPCPYPRPLPSLGAQPTRPVQGGGWLGAWQELRVGAWPAGGQEACPEKVSGRSQSPPGAGRLAALEGARHPVSGFVPDLTIQNKKKNPQSNKKEEESQG